MQGTICVMVRFFQLKKLVFQPLYIAYNFRILAYNKRELLYKRKQKDGKKAMMRSTLINFRQLPAKTFLKRVAKYLNDQMQNVSVKRVLISPITRALNKLIPKSKIKMSRPKFYRYIGHNS